MWFGSDLQSRFLKSIDVMCQKKKKTGFGWQSEQGLNVLKVYLLFSFFFQKDLWGTVIYKMTCGRGSEKMMFKWKILRLAEELTTTTWGGQSSSEELFTDKRLAAVIEEMSLKGRMENRLGQMHVVWSLHQNQWLKQKDFRLCLLSDLICV